MLQPNTQTIYSITLNSLPSSGIIAFNGTQYQSGNTVQVAAGNYPINAIPPANFIFSSWMFANTIYITNAGNQNTIATISGNGTITANFFGNVIFIEKGLPANTVWSVDIDGITMNALSPSSIVFQPMPPGAYIFAVANQTISNTLYIASPSNGNVVAGNTTSITFSPTATSKTSPASTTIPANTIYYSLAFNSVPSAGIISFNGIGYQNGNAIQVAPGNYPINAIAPANFIFSSWISTNSVNLTLANPYSANTNLAVSGSGVVTAIFNGITTFSENGLPTNTQWRLEYNGVFQNAIAPNSIIFSALPGNYFFTVANQIANNILYFPEPGSGSLVAGNTTSITFATKNVMLAFNDIPATGNIVFNGITYANGASNTMFAGIYTVNAIAPANFIFSNWHVSNAANFTFNSVTANPTTLTVSGNGMITAEFNGITTFSENGLPSGTKWNVTYDNILNSATTNTITFSTQPGNYLFTVANQVVSNVIYFPAPSSGSVVAGNTTSITFSPTTTKVSSASTTSSTSTSTSSTSSVSSTSTIIPANTIYYSLAFNSVPSAGIISFNGIGYQNGNAIQVAPGNYPINAIAPANFIFSNWASSNSMNLTLANPYSANTTLAVSGNGVVTASFNAITTFSESGLPASTIWSVIYGNYTLNAIAPNSITFSTPPGNYTFGVPNTMVANTIYVPVQSSGYLAAGNALSISFSLQQAVISSASINSTLSNITNFLSSNGIFAGSVFISNSSIIGATENRTTANIIAPIELSYQELSNLIPLNRQQLARAMRLVGNSMHVFSKNITAPYGMVMQNNRYINAGRELHYIAYNRHGIVTFYNVSIEKAIPRLAIKINGAAVSTPNSTSEVYVPIMPGQKSYKLSLSLESSLLSGNLANYSYKIIFSNDTAINGSINGNYVSYSKVFVLSSNESAKIIFDVSGNANYTAEDPSALVIPANIEYYVPITLSNSQAVATPVPFQDLLPVNSLAYSAYEAKNLDNIEFFYANGNVIPSWMEGSSSNTLLNNPTNSIYLYTSTNTLYWLNISSGIAASNSITIYMGFASTSQNLLNNIDDGEAPQLSSTWGLYDDGPHVFTQYGGGSWSSFTFVGGTWSTTN
ncbi:MAG: hypothetical protein QXG73_02565, partial [Candidatus Micrarchaeaceae archaeon]